ncbi:unnamed protein product [Ceratitis capitata]|uniref:(Mediterranean fruit fly) hypothetical protein n=1 Tax=Ceratitis capitata TaxID=7213 RepID=A0A811UUD0_CERCA|nr:unnamed protein product [Ceratitis capitata]
MSLFNLMRDSSSAFVCHNLVGTVLLYGIPIVSLYIEGQERLCLAQISNTLLKQYSYNEIHNRRVALGITCVQCTPVQLEILRRAGAMPVSSRRCGMITRREAERLCKSFLGDNAPPRLPENFAFTVYHKCAWGCRGSFLPSRYNSSRAKCIKCSYCGMFFSPNKFIFHSHRITAGDKYVQPDAANFNSWRRHLILSGQPAEDIVHAWEDVKAMFNGGTRKRAISHGFSATQTYVASQRQQKQNQLEKNINLGKPAAATLTRVSNESGSSKTIMTTGKPVSSHYHCHGIEVSPCETLCNSPQPSPPTNCQYQQHDDVGSGPTAAVVGVTAVAATVGTMRPLTLGNTTTHGVSYHGRTSNVSALQLADSNEQQVSLLPLSHNFMMDYMWHKQAAQNAAIGGNKNQNTNNSYNSVFKPKPTNGGTFPNTSQELRDLSKVTDEKNYETQFPTPSAFKPVLQQRQQNVFKAVTAVSATTTLAATPIYPATATETFVEDTTRTTKGIITCSRSSIEEKSLPKTDFTSTTTSATSSFASSEGDALLGIGPSEASLALTVHANFCATSGLLFHSTLPQTPATQIPPSTNIFDMSPVAPYRSSILAPVSLQCDLKRSNIDITSSYIKSSPSSGSENNNNEICGVEDDEVVDIETTEDDLPANNNLKGALSIASSRHHQPVDDTNFVEFQRNYQKKERRINGLDLDKSSDEVLTIETTEYTWPNRSATPNLPEYLKRDKRHQPVQIFQNKLTPSNASADSTTFDRTCQQQIQTALTIANAKSNEQLKKDFERFQASPTNSSVSNDIIYTKMKDESYNDSSSSVEITNNNCKARKRNRHNAYYFRPPLIWKRLLSSEVRIIQICSRSGSGDVIL